MKNLEPYLRFVARTSSLPNKRHTIAYDCRFLYVLSGSGKFLTHESEISLYADNLLYYPSGVAYHLKSAPDDPMEFITVNFDFTSNYDTKELLCPVYIENYNPELLQPSQKEIDEPCFLSAFVVGKANNVLVYLVKMIDVINCGGKYSEELCSSLLRSLILEIFYKENNGLPKNKIVRDAMEYIRNNYKQSLSNGNIAAAVKYHPYYLGALFREYLGKTVRDYVDEVRLKRAEELLVLTDDSIYEISCACGYKTPEHFTRRFKICYGITPTVWRKRNHLI